MLILYMLFVSNLFATIADEAKEPWVLITLAIIAAIGASMGPIMSYRASKISKEVRKETAEVRKETAEHFETAIGIPNGEGSLLDQTKQMTKNQNIMLENQNNLLEKLLSLNDHLMSHVNESVRDRTNIHFKLSQLEKAIAHHVHWEQDVKYPEMMNAMGKKTPLSTDDNEPDVINDDDINNL